MVDDLFGMRSVLMTKSKWIQENTIGAFLRQNVVVRRILFDVFIIIDVPTFSLTTSLLYCQAEPRMVERFLFKGPIDFLVIELRNTRPHKSVNHHTMYIFYVNSSTFPIFTALDVF